MRRTLVLLTVATSLVLGAGPAAAGGPPTRTFDHDCRIGTQCNTSQHNGWDGVVPERRNVGG